MCKWDGEGFILAEKSPRCSLGREHRELLCLNSARKNRDVFHMEVNMPVYSTAIPAGTGTLSIQSLAPHPPCPRHCWEATGFYLSVSVSPFITHPRVICADKPQGEYLYKGSSVGVKLCREVRVVPSHPQEWDTGQTPHSLSLQELPSHKNPCGFHFRWVLGRLWPQVRKGCVFISQGQTSSLYHPQAVYATAPSATQSPLEPGGCAPAQRWGEIEHGEKKRGPSRFGVLNPPLACSVLLQVENKTRVRVGAGAWLNSCPLGGERRDSGEQNSHRAVNG